MLKVNQLSKSFGHKNAVKQLSFRVETSQVYCLLGGNGAGKTTTLNMLLGFIEPDSGYAEFNSIDLWKDRRVIQKSIFYLPENINLYSELTAIENLKYLTQLSGLTIDEATIKKALIECGLAEQAHNKSTRAFSKGMRQKAGLALARLKDAKLLLLDEPTSGLDPSATYEFVQLIQRLKAQGATIVMITHDLQCACLLADEIGILQAGKLVQNITNNDLTLEKLEQYYFQSTI
ncbi:ABC transporter ATP-binding protein [Aliikangiella maris]|uniref:ABC transporter ATP-binding protein n=2 Tax=Aliikangiella maris TaxID=3162458 RepID=A0ABV3MTP4_9GAMM